MVQFCIDMLKGMEVSTANPPYYLKIYRECEYKFMRYRRYLKREPMSGYLELAFLPLGEYVGYDNHPAYMIEDIELIINSYNEAQSKLSKAKSKSKTKRR